MLKSEFYTGLYFMVWLKFNFDVKIVTENKLQTYV